jgi:hypothetical protein
VGEFRLKRRLRAGPFLRLNRKDWGEKRIEKSGYGFTKINL